MESGDENFDKDDDDYEDDAKTECSNHQENQYLNEEEKESISPFKKSIEYKKAVEELEKMYPDN